MAEQQPSRYHFIEKPRGVRIEGENRNPVVVELQDTFLLVNHKAFGLYEYYSLSRFVAEQLMSDWTPPADKLVQSRERLSRKEGIAIEELKHYQPTWVRRWAVSQTAKAIGKRLHSDWKRLLSLVDQNVLAVHRAVYAATTDVAKVTRDPALYRERHLVSDIIKFRAAASAALYIDNLVFISRWHRFKYLDERMKNSPEMKALNTLAHKVGFDIKVKYDVSKDLDWRMITSIERIEHLINWRDLFSRSGRSYRSLDRTLMN